MKLRKHYLFALLPAALLMVASVGCGGDDPNAAAPTENGASADDHDHDDPDHEDHGDEHADEHDHEHGPNGLPVVTLSDGSKLEWDFDEETSEFTVIPFNNDLVTGIVVKTVVEDNEKTYEFEQEETDDGTRWVLTDQQLGTAMMMGDAVKRTLVVATSDDELTAPVKHFEAH